MRNVSFWHFQISGTFKIGNTKVKQRKFGEQSSWRQIYTQKIILFKISNTSSVASPYYFWGNNSFDFKRATVFCLRHRPAKRKMTRYARNLGGPWPPWSHGYVYVKHMWTFVSLTVEIAFKQNEVLLLLERGAFLLIGRSQLRWFGHATRLPQERFLRRVQMATTQRSTKDQGGVITNFPSKVRNNAVPPDHLRSEISLSHTCNIPNLISYIYCIEILPIKTFTDFVSAW